MDSRVAAGYTLPDAHSRRRVLRSGTTGVTVFEGARLITGTGGPPIKDSVFIVQNGQFTQVGQRGKLRVPVGAAHVDLTGKTVMPGKVDLPGHIGFQHDVDGTMATEYYRRENLIDHLQRLAYYRTSPTCRQYSPVNRC